MPDARRQARTPTSRVRIARASSSGPTWASGGQRSRQLRPGSSKKRGWQISWIPEEWNRDAHRLATKVLANAHPCEERVRYRVVRAAKRSGCIQSLAEQERERYVLKLNQLSATNLVFHRGPLRSHPTGRPHLIVANPKRIVQQIELSRSDLPGAKGMRRSRESGLRPLANLRLSTGVDRRSHCG